MLIAVLTLQPKQIIFINIDPQTINDPNFVKGETKAILELLGLTPANVVLELTERRSIQDFATFRKVTCQIIAEGIETLQELETLIELGITLGQGYLLARPTSPPSSLNKTARYIIQQNYSRRSFVPANLLIS